jgi:hypothetical protein
MGVHCERQAAIWVVVQPDVEQPVVVHAGQLRPLQQLLKPPLVAPHHFPYVVTMSAPWAPQPT